MQEEGWKFSFFENNITAEKKVENYEVMIKTFGKKFKKDLEDDRFKEIDVYIKN